MLRYKLREESLTFSSAGEGIVVAPGGSVTGDTILLTHISVGQERSPTLVQQVLLPTFRTGVCPSLEKPDAHMCVTSALDVCYDN